MDDEPDQESMIGSALPNGHCSREGVSSESDSTPLTLRRKSDCDRDAVPHLGSKTTFQVTACLWPVSCRPAHSGTKPCACADKADKAV